jgi:hypothetical protein
MSQASGRSHITLDVKVYAPCKKHVGKSTQFCGCKPQITAIGHKEHDLKTSQYARLEMAGVFASTQTSAVKDVDGDLKTVAAGFTASAPTICTGTGSTTPDVDDYAIETPVTDTPAGTGKIAATVGSYSGGTTTGAFTITGTITNGSAADITYKEIGVEVTIATFVYLVLHDLVNGATGYLVSIGGTMACTYTITNS